jgi:hypothetical protein
MLVALLALFVALGGPAQAKHLINGKDIRRGTVASAQIKDRSLAERDLSPTAVRALQVTPDSSIGADKLIPGAIGGLQIADGTVSGTDLVDGTVSAADIADGAIGSGKLADSSVTGAKIADGTLVAADLGASGSAIVDPPSIAANSCAVVTAPAPGVPANARLILNVPSDLDPGLFFSGAVTGTAAGTISARVCNVTGGGIADAAKTWSFLAVG